MGREEKLLILYALTAFFALIFHGVTTNERMARAGYLPHRLAGDMSIYWYRPHDEKKEAHAEQLVPAF